VVSRSDEVLLIYGKKNIVCKAKIAMWVIWHDYSSDELIMLTLSLWKQSMVCWLWVVVEKDQTVSYLITLFCYFWFLDGYRRQVAFLIMWGCICIWYLVISLLTMSFDNLSSKMIITFYWLSFLCVHSFSKSVRKLLLMPQTRETWHA